MKRIGLILLSLFLLCACQSGIEATLEDSVIVAMDDSNVSEEEITSLSKEEKRGIIILYLKRLRAIMNTKLVRMVKSKIETISPLPVKM